MKNTIILTTAVLSSIGLTGCGANAAKETVLPPEFAGFSQIEANTTYSMPAITSAATILFNNGTIDSGEFLGSDLNASVSAEYDASAEISKVSIKDKNYTAFEFPTIDNTGTYYIDGTNAQKDSVYFDKASGAGNEYQTYGVWNSEFTGDFAETVVVGVFSTGLRTNFSDIPTALSYDFLGYYDGYVTYSGTPFYVVGDLDLAVNFQLKTVTLESYGSDLYNAITGISVGSDTDLDMIGSLTYTDSNYFSGNVSSNLFTGTAEGYFYGPNANEAGGVINADNIRGDAFIASFGAKR